MTQKELLYMEDAIGHEANTIEILYNTIDMVEDKNLKIFLKAHLKKHQNLKQKLMNVLEDTINE